MDIGMMKTYVSKTGYVRRKNTEEVYEANTLYLGIYDNEDNYEDVSKEEYDEIVKTQEEELNGNDRHEGQ